MTTPETSSQAGAEPTSSTRVTLLDAAAAIIEQRHADIPGVAEVARAAGVSRPTVYAHFGTAESVFEAVVACLRDDVLALQEAADTSSPAATYRSTLLDTLDLTVDHVGLLSMLVSHARDDPRMAAMWRDIHDRPLARHARFIERLTARGLADPAASPWVIAEAIDGAITRFAQLIVEDPTRRQPLGESLLALQRRLVGLVDEPDGDYRARPARSRT